MVYLDMVSPSAYVVNLSTWGGSYEIHPQFLEKGGSIFRSKAHLIYYCLGYQQSLMNIKSASTMAMCRMQSLNVF